MDRIDFWMNGIEIFLKCFEYLVKLFLLVMIIVILFVRQKNKEQNKIQTENGIQEKSFINLGNEKQYIYISGENKYNPVILFIHGGPGSPMTCLAYYYQKELEKDYVIVNWEQRGGGRTYRKDSQLSISLLYSDIDELVDYLKDRFDKKVILMGHSWGTVPASEYAYNHPKKITAYIALSQIVNLVSGTLFASQTAIKKAEEKGKHKDTRKIKKLTNFLQRASAVDTAAVAKYLKLRMKTSKYLFSEKLKSRRKILWYGMVSPDFSIEDLNWLLNCISIKKFVELQHPLIEYMMFDFDVRKMKEYEIPVYFISGTQDWITPVIPVEDYYEDIIAPHKKMIKIEHAGHDLFIDQPALFANAVRTLMEE